MKAITRIATSKEFLITMLLSMILAVSVFAQSVELRNGAEVKADLLKKDQCESLDATIVYGPKHNYHQFYATNFSDSYEVFWNFGDGETSTHPFPAHAFREKGAYEVTLTITSACGVANTSSTLVIVDRVKQDKLMYDKDGI